MRFKVTGMNCAACSARVEKAVSSIPGISSCAVNLLTGDLSVSGDVPSGVVIAAVTEAGYGCISADAAETSPQKTDIHKETEIYLGKCLKASVCILIPLMYVSMGIVMNGLPAPAFLKGNPAGLALAELLLSAACMLVNKRFFISGFRGIAHRAPNMDTLVAMGSSVSWLYSLVLTFFITAEPSRAHEYLHGLYFESAAMILTLITVGKMLEARSKGKTTDAVKALIKLKPSTARLLEGETETIVNAASLKAGDMFVLRPGDAVPADGTVVSGNSAVDQSALTGESIPLEKTEGDKVFAATVNRQGYLICRAEKTGEDTAFSGIISLMNEAAATKAPIARIADKVSGVFVPAVLAIAVVTFIIWIFSGESVGYALERGISVLVISCPCALGLATPVAIMVGSGTAARMGILFKTSEALEQTGKIKYAAFDKTGTLTEGKPSVTDICALSDEMELLTAAASVEKLSEHPLAEAITAYCSEHGIHPMPVSDFTATGSMVSCMSSGSLIKGGSRKAMTDVTVPEALIGKEKKLSSEGKTPIYFSYGGKCLGIIALSDNLRPESAEAVKQMAQLGITPVMITGDNEVTAGYIARKAGIEKVYAGVLPGGKADVIRELEKNGLTMMVGDGINDAVALKTADIGTAIGAGTDAAVEAADVVLMKTDLRDTVAAVKLSRKVLANIKQNLFWAFFYNCLCIPLAAGVFIRSFGLRITPMFGAAAMSLSSVFVVTNALRLRKSDRNTDNGIFEKSKMIREKKIMTITLTIDGMMCPHCEARVKKALEGVSGVTEAVVSHKEGTAVVTGSASEEELKKAVTDAGYEVR